MGDQYTLTLKNRSSQPALTFAVYSVAPGDATNGNFPIAWLTKALNQGNDVTFTWTLDFSLMFSDMGAQAGAVWKESGRLAVSDDSLSRNCAQLGYENGDYAFGLSDGGHPVVPGEVFLNTTAALPPWDAAAGPSIALAIATGKDKVPTPAIAGNSGPNLKHTFELHPTYFVRAGQVEQGLMADLDTVTEGQEVVFEPGVYDATWIFNQGNTWSRG